MFGQYIGLVLFEFQQPIYLCTVCATKPQLIFCHTPLGLTTYWFNAKVKR